MENEIATHNTDNKPPKKRKYAKIAQPEFSYASYLQENIVISKYKIPELKDICRKEGLRISGTKGVLVTRINEHMKQISGAIKVQHCYRKHMGRIFFRKRGPASSNREICVNATDPVTLEPLDEIEHVQFYSYDDKGQIYGFDISTLIGILKNSHNSEIMNPYTRAVICKKVTNDIILTYNITCIIHSEFRKDNEIYVSRTVRFRQYARPRPRVIVSNFNQYRPRVNYTAIQNSGQLDQLNRISRMREENIETRIQNLFMEIDSLGNYTNAEWFNELTRRQYIMLYRMLYETWNFSSRIPYDLQRRICPFYNPFDGIVERSRSVNDITYDNAQKMCLIVLENFVYCGIDIEIRKIGTMHALSALTLVSQPAREVLPWLYESVA